MLSRLERLHEVIRKQVLVFLRKASDVVNHLPSIVLYHELRRVSLASFLKIGMLRSL